MFATRTAAFRFTHLVGVRRYETATQRLAMATSICWAVFCSGGRHDHLLYDAAGGAKPTPLSSLCGFGRDGAGVSDKVPSIHPQALTHERRGVPARLFITRLFVPVESCPDLPVAKTGGGAVPERSAGVMRRAHLRPTWCCRADLKPHPIRRPPPGAPAAVQAALRCHNGLSGAVWTHAPRRTHVPRRPFAFAIRRRGSDLCLFHPRRVKAAGSLPNLQRYIRKIGEPVLCAITLRLQRCSICSLLFSVLFQRLSFRDESALAEP